MTRVSSAPATRNRRKKVLKRAKGFFGSKHKLFRTAKEQVMRSLVYSYRDRKQKKRDFRRLWITRIGIACEKNEDLKLNYSKFMNLTKLAQIKLNRKQLSEMAVNNPDSFRTLLEKVSRNPW